MITIALKERNQKPKVRPKSENPPSRALNLGAVLELGDTTYFPFRGRAYGIPPLPWRAGEVILDIWLEIQSFKDLNRQNLPQYFSCICRLQRQIWRNVRPRGRIARLLYHVGLLRNPFWRATEAELIELALFLLQRRTSTPVQGPRPARRTRRIVFPLDES